MADDAPILDKSKVVESFTVLALQVPSKRTGELLKRLKDHLLNLPRRKNVERSSCQGSNLVLLSRSLSSLDSLPPADLTWVNEQISGTDVELTRYTVELPYEYFSAEEVLRKILPAGIDIPSSFEQAGQVCHLNLRDSQLPYRYCIAEVILDKNKSVKTVVNKTGKIESEFRTFPMEHLAGDTSTIVRLREHQCWFEFEYKDVYWNSRLQEEHGRLIDALFINPVLPGQRPRPVLADCTCGIGPFSVPVAKQVDGVVCHANDLNPASVHWLTRNAELNKLPHVDKVAGLPPYSDVFAPPDAGSGSRLAIYQPGDARDFVRGLYNGMHPVTHALFNLPATGIELLDCFRGLDYAQQGLPAPLVCCYTFSDAAIDSASENGCVADLLSRLAVALDVDLACLSYVDAPERRRLPLPSPQVADMVRMADNLPEKGTAVSIRLVRNVAPSRHMFCVCFRVPLPRSAEPPEKRSKVNGEA